MCQIKPKYSFVSISTFLTLGSPHILDIGTSHSRGIASSSSSAVSWVARCELTRSKPASKLDPDQVLLTDMAQKPAPWAYGEGGVETIWTNPEGPKILLR